MRQLHPNRLRFSIFSDRNQLMLQIAPPAVMAREQRQPVSSDNPFLAFERQMSSWITSSLEAWGAARDAMEEGLFLTAYGSPVLRAGVGLGQVEEGAGRRVERDLVREADAARARAALEERFEVGEPVAAALRAICYVNEAEGNFDERQFAVLRRFHDAQPLKERRSFGELKEILKEQSLLVRLDGERAVAAIPKLIADQPEKGLSSLDVLHKVIDARDGLSEEGRRRLERVEPLFETSPSSAAGAEAPHA